MRYEFTVVIERDPESGWLIGSVSELPGCYTQAPTLAELDPISGKLWRSISPPLPKKNR